VAQHPLIVAHDVRSERFPDVAIQIDTLHASNYTRVSYREAAPQTVVIRSAHLAKSYVLRTTS
jgi:hypothetical protein